MSRFVKRSKRIETKEAQLTKEMFDKLCLKRPKLSKKEYKKILERYAKEISKLELKKYGLHRAITFKEINVPGRNGSLSYGKGLTFYTELGKHKIGMGSVLALNYDNVIDKLISDDKDVRCAGGVKYVETTFHELWHLMQHVGCDCKKKFEEMPKVHLHKFGMEFAAKREFGDEYYKKGDNYRKMLIEQSARDKGITSVIDIFSKIYGKKFLGGILTNKKMNDLFKDSFVELENLEGEKGIANRFTLTTELVDKAIERNPKYLKEVPILQEVYTLDGKRKPIYQIVRQNAITTRKLQMNPFIPPKVKKQKIQETQDLYSEIFSESLKQCSKNDIILDKKVLGGKALKSMINISKNHYAREYNAVEKNAKDEIKIRDFLDGNSRLNRSIYKERMENNLNRYAPYINLLDELDVVVEEINVKKMSPSQVKEQLKKDKKKVEYNIQRRKSRKMTTNVTSKAKPCYGEFAVAEEEQDINIEEMRDLKEGYQELRDVSVINLEQTKEEYYTKLEQEKSKEIENNTKEK